MIFCPQLLLTKPFSTPCERLSNPHCMVVVLNGLCCAKLTLAFHGVFSQGSVCYLRRGGPAEVGCCLDARFGALLAIAWTGMMLTKPLRKRFCNRTNYSYLLFCWCGYCTTIVVASTRMSDEIFFCGLCAHMLHCTIDSLGNSSQASNIRFHSKKCIMSCDVISLRTTNMHA
jgi:hypothetical protein